MSDDLVEAVRVGWGWIGIEPVAVLAIDRFGHLVIRDVNDAFWHLDPELATLERVAEDESGLARFWADPEVEEVWRAEALVSVARVTLGEPGDGCCYAWKMPTLLGGGFGSANMCILPIAEMVRFSGDLAEQTRDLPDGSQVRLRVVS